MPITWLAFALNAFSLFERTSFSHAKARSREEDAMKYKPILIRAKPPRTPRSRKVFE
jgi:hypothetical protein